MFRGVARLVGAATVGAAVAPTTGALCHVYPPVSNSSREQENPSAILNHVQKETCDVNADVKDFGSFVNVRFELEEGTAEKEEGSRGTGLRQLVFYPPPTEEEVEEATKELHAALHLALPAEGSMPEGNSADSEEEFTMNEDDIDIASHKRELADSSSSSKSLGNFALENSPVMQAFQLLKTNPKVQDVVKSLACDPAVWNAVLSNEKVLELAQEEARHSQDSFDDDEEEYGDDYDDEDDDDDLYEMKELATVVASKFYGLVRRTKVYYSFVRGKLFSVLDTMFGSMEKTLLRTKGGTSAKDKTVASCMMLAVAVVIVVVVRRGLRRH